MYSTALHCTVLYCTVLYSTVHYTTVHVVVMTLAIPVANTLSVSIRCTADICTIKRRTADRQTDRQTFLLTQLH